MKSLSILIISALLSSCNIRTDFNDQATVVNKESVSLSEELIITPASFYIQSKVNETKTFSLYIQNQSDNQETNLIGELTSDTPIFNIVTNECTNKLLKPFESCRVELSVKNNHVNLSTTRFIIGNKRYTAQADIVFRSLPDTDQLVLTNTYEHINQNSVLRYNLNKAVASGEAHGYSIVGNPNNGTISLDSSSGKLEYTPQANFVGNDYFSFRTSDVYGNESNIAIFQIIVGKSDLAPKAFEQNLTVVDGKPVTFSLLAQDPNNNKLTYTIVTQPTKGKIKVNQNNYTYTPNANVQSNDSFTFKVNNGTLDSNIANVKIISIDSLNALTLPVDDFNNEEETGNLFHNTTGGVSDGGTATSPTNNPNNTGTFIGGVPLIPGSTPESPISNNTPVAPTPYSISSSNLSLTAIEDQSLNVVLQASDDSASFQIISQPQHGTLSGTVPNLIYTPNPDYFGADSFTYKAYNKGVGSNISTVSISVQNVNDLPETSDLSHSMRFDEPATILLPVHDKDNDNLNAVIMSQPQHGTLSGAYPNLIYTPEMFYIGADSFTFKFNDGIGESEVKTIFLNIVNTTNNYAPVANNQNVAVTEDNVTNIALNTSDINNDTLSFTLIQAPLHGSVSFVNGEAIYTPNLNYTGTDSFVYQANDGQLTSNPATISLNISNENDAPITYDQTISLNEDETGAITLTGSDIENDELTYILVSNPTNGTLGGTLPNLIYTPNLNFNGTDSFTYKVNDGQLDSDLKTISLNIAPVNDAPIANTNSYTTDENEAVNIVLSGSDIDADALAYEIVSSPAHGVLSGTLPNLVYTPNAYYAGNDSFTFKVNDGTVDSVVETINISINNLNFAPTANNISTSTPEDSPLNITLSGSDPDSDSLTYQITNPPMHGTLSGSLPNLVYTPNLNYNGTDSFTYVVNDGYVNSPGEIVSITVTPVNDAPVAFDQGVVLDEEQATNISVIASDVDGDTLSYILVSGPSHGTLSGTLPNLTYTPNLNYTGNDSFTFKVNDGSVDSNIATVSLTVNNVNDAPIANNLNWTTDEDTAKNLVLSSTDPDGDTLSYIIVSQPANGTLTGTPPNLTYTPNPNFNGSDSFTFKTNDGSVDSNIATVSITVTPVNDAPIANNFNFSTNEDTAYNGTLQGSDVDGDTLTYSIIGTPSNGTITIINLQTGAFVYTPNSNFNGADSFSYTVSDGVLTSAISNVSIDVIASNDIPTSTASNFTTNKNITLNDTLTASDSDGDPLTFMLVSSTSNGVLNLNANGTFSYVPNNNYYGTDSFNFKVNDGTDDSIIYTATITVINTNTAPVAQNLIINISSDALPYSGQLVATDVDGDNLIYSMESGSGVFLNSNGSFNYSTNSSTTFTYKVNDGTLDSNVATVTINVQLRDNKFKISTNPSLINASISNFSLMIDLQDFNHLEHFWSNVQSDGGDIVITLNDQETRLPVAVRNFNKTARTGQLWFKSNVVANTKTDFYLHYNNESSADITMASPSSTYGSNKVWENNYIAYWDMHMKSSAVSNATSSTLNMTKVSNPISLINGHNDQAVELNTDGLKDDYLSAPFSSEAQLENEVTISAWVYPTKSVADSIILRREGKGGKDNYSLRLDALKPYFTFDNNCGAKSITAAQAIPLNRWTHITGTFNRATTKSSLFVNGILVFEGDATNHDHDSVGNHPIVIGRLESSASQEFEGSLDEVKLSHRSLSPEWIQLEYNMTNQDNMFWLIEDETVVFSENFNRVNNNTVGNSWTEYEGCSGNPNLSVFMLGLLGINITSANTNCGYMRVESNSLDFYTLADSQAFPELTRSLSNLNSGIVKISFDVNFKKTGTDNDYAFIINFGENNKSIGELIWGSTNHGLSSDLGFGVVEKSLASVQQIKTINHKETINIIIDFTHKHYSIFTKGAGLEEISFEDSNAVLNKISFIVNRVNSTQIPIIRIDNIIIKHKN